MCDGSAFGAARATNDAAPRLQKKNERNSPTCRGIEKRVFHRSSHDAPVRRFAGLCSPVFCTPQLLITLLEAHGCYAAYTSQNPVSGAWKVWPMCFNGLCCPKESRWEPPKQYHFDLSASPDSRLPIAPESRRTLINGGYYFSSGTMRTGFCVGHLSLHRHYSSPPDPKQ